jgi:RNA polymerase sigma-70 factor (ECF subfamily)
MRDPEPVPPAGPAGPTRVQDLSSTADLLARVRGGDEVALNYLVTLYLPLLRRWAHGRLPVHSRGLSDTEDLVQITLIRVLRQVEGFDARRPGAFLAYLRSSLLNNLRNEIRNEGRRPKGDSTGPDLPDPARSPLEQAIGRKAVDAYEQALEQLTEEQKTAVILRIELGCKHGEIAELLGSPSANAARMLVSRGVVRLAELLTEAKVADGD